VIEILCHKSIPLFLDGFVIVSDMRSPCICLVTEHAIGKNLPSSKNKGRRGGERERRAEKTEERSSKK